MKSFKDLVFETHTTCKDGTQARLDFDNGYGVSVITGSMFYTDAKGLYEVAVMHNGKLCYDTPITEDVIGHLDRKEVEEVMTQVQALVLPKLPQKQGFISVILANCLSICSGDMIIS